MEHSDMQSVGKIRRNVSVKGQVKQQIKMNTDKLKVTRE